MSKAENTKPEVFIIESLKWCDEREERYEGRILKDFLRMCGKKPIYYYVRTKRELIEVMKTFRATNYRYLHLSCHGDEESIATTLDDIDFKELGKILKASSGNRRLFVSSCEVVNNSLAEEVIIYSGWRSVTGPTEEICFSDAAILWASFYKLAFDRNNRGMNGKSIRLILAELATLFNVPVAHYREKDNSKGYCRQIFDPRSS